MKQSPFSEAYDLMAWLIPCTLAFPKSQRGVLARQVQTDLFRTNEWQVDAGTAEDPLPALAEADKSLIRLRTYLRLCRDPTGSVGQYEHGSRLTAEVGKLLGGWINPGAIRAQHSTAATAM